MRNPYATSNPDSNVKFQQDALSPDIRPIQADEWQQSTVDPLAVVLVTQLRAYSTFFIWKGHSQARRMYKLRCTLTTQNDIRQRHISHICRHIQSQTPVQLGSHRGRTDHPARTLTSANAHDTSCITIDAALAATMPLGSRRTDFVWPAWSSLALPWLLA